MDLAHPPQQQHRQRQRTRPLTLGRPRARTPSPAIVNANANANAAAAALFPRDDATTTACALCATITPCMNCGKGEVCQQIFRPQGDCQTCPSNVCVSDGSSSSGGSNKAAAIAGPLGGVFGTLAVALVLVYFWWKRRKQKLARRATARAEAKMRDAKTKGFLLGAGGAQGPGGDGDDDEDDDDEQHRDAGARRRTDAETEWTELRADGLTAFRSSPQGGAGEARLHLDVGQPLDLLGASFDSQRRHSSAAATHLSRITEGHEGDEDDEDDDDGVAARKSHRFKDHIGVLDNIEIISSADATVRVFNTHPRNDSRNDSRTDSRADSRTSSISSGRRASDQHARSRSRRSLRNPFEPEDELAADAADHSTSSTPVPGGRSSLGSTLSAFPVRGGGGGGYNDGGLPPMPMEPMPAHRPTGAPLVGLDMPSGSGKRQGPARPIRDADLNLRLADGSEPGKVGADLKRNKTNGSAGTWRSSVGVHAYSPAAPSTAHSRQFNLLDEEPLPPHPSIPSQYSEPSQSPASAPTPEEHAGAGAGAGEFLQVSGDWEERQRRQRKRLSARSTATTGTTATSASDYVMASPQIVMARSPNDAPRAVQVKRGAAQLVRNLSDLRRKGSLKKKDGGAGAGAGAGGAGSASAGTPVTSPQQEVRDPFSDENSVAHDTPRPADDDDEHDAAETVIASDPEPSPTTAVATSPAASDGTFGPRTVRSSQQQQPLTATTITTATVISPGPSTASTGTTQGSTLAGEEIAFGSEAGRDAVGAHNPPRTRSTLGTSLGWPSSSSSDASHNTHGTPSAAASAGADAHVGAAPEEDGDRRRTDSMSTYSSFGIPIMDLTKQGAGAGAGAAGVGVGGNVGAGHPPAPPPHAPAQAQTSSNPSAVSVPQAPQAPHAPARDSGASWTLPYLSESSSSSGPDAGTHARDSKLTPTLTPAPRSQARPAKADRSSAASAGSIGGLSVLDGFAWSVRTGDDDADGEGTERAMSPSSARTSAATTASSTPTPTPTPIA